MSSYLNDQRALCHSPTAESPPNHKYLRDCHSTTVPNITKVSAPLIIKLYLTWHLVLYGIWGWSACKSCLSPFIIPGVEDSVLCLPSSTWVVIENSQGLAWLLLLVTDYRQYWEEVGCRFLDRHPTVLSKWPCLRPTAPAHMKSQLFSHSLPSLTQPKAWCENFKRF